MNVKALNLLKPIPRHDLNAVPSWQILNFWKNFTVHLIIMSQECSAVDTEYDLFYTAQQGVGVTAYTKLLSAPHHLLEPPETYIMHATPVQSPSRIKYWTKNSRHAVLKAPPLWSIFISLERLLFLFLSDARSKWALAPTMRQPWVARHVTMETASFSLCCWCKKQDPHQRWEERKWWMMLSGEWNPA